VLPSPVYFISTQDEQLWRIASDGRTLTQLTREAAPVTGFDVFPGDGALVYVAGNQLIRADGQGGNRIVLLAGPALTGAEDDFVARQIQNPRWSPDGAQIAFGLNGLNLIAAAGGQPQLIEASDPVPTTRALARFYNPHAWSPDGTRIVVTVHFWQEGLIYAIKDLASGTLLEIDSACCDPIWSRDGQSLYLFGSSPEGYNPPGLWRVDAATGTAVTLLEGRSGDDPNVRLVANPFELPDGTLLFLLATQLPNADGVYEWPARFQLASLPAGAPAGTAPTLVRPEASAYFTAAWASAGNGLVIREVDPSTQPISGALTWLPADPALPALSLPGDGLLLRVP
jgi:Tol biopolymer transport system component